MMRQMRLTIAGGVASCQMNIDGEFVGVGVGVELKTQPH